MRTVHVLISDYPWRFPNSTTDSNVVKWLYIPDFRTKPSPSFLICTFHLCSFYEFKTFFSKLWICGNYDDKWWWLMFRWLKKNPPLLSSPPRWLHVAAVCLSPEAGLWRWEQGGSPHHGWRQRGDLQRPGCSLLQCPQPRTWLPPLQVQQLTPTLYYIYTAAGSVI